MGPGIFPTAKDIRLTATHDEKPVAYFFLFVFGEKGSVILVVSSGSSPTLLVLRPWKAGLA